MRRNQNQKFRFDHPHGSRQFLGGLVCEEEGEKKYLLPVFVPTRSELSSNISLLDKPSRQTKYDHFLVYQD
jgi:hypothetical protein